ncbi:hypothetical protein An02g05110 [Aspergillus niger]|uniref:Uncharacterized protein n=2 Tax=Aspergillus niger TaxID=5061 RepID=A2QCX9_ASPNC|nr:hypothetical protein An02g05110 [Aspergillus niger]CAK37619.1 hypothetical protein An02g05110 [Aspergillus niger]
MPHEPANQCACHRGMTHPEAPFSPLDPLQQRPQGCLVSVRLSCQLWGIPDNFQNSSHEATAREVFSQVLVSASADLHHGLSLSLSPPQATANRREHTHGLLIIATAEGDALRMVLNARPTQQRLTQRARLRRPSQLGRRPMAHLRLLSSTNDIMALHVPRAKRAGRHALPSTRRMGIPTGKHTGKNHAATSLAPKTVLFFII